jgi:hypothetical protein
MTHLLKSFLLAAVITAAFAPTIVLAQRSTSTGTPTNAPSAECTDVAADPNCKPNQNQKEQSDNLPNSNPEGSLNNPASEAEDPAAQNSDQTPGSTGSPENASGGNAVSPSGLGNVESDNAGGAGSTGGSNANN